MLLMYHHENSHPLNRLPRCIFQTQPDHGNCNLLIYQVKEKILILISDGLIPVRDGQLQVSGATSHEGVGEDPDRGKSEVL